MNRARYYDFIDEQLHILAMRINTNGKLNLLNLHNHSENFYVHFFNKIYDYNLENLNSFKQNIEGIDLVDHKNKIVLQVSSTNTKKKIEDSLKKEIIQQYRDYTFKFISISKDATALRKKNYKNPHSISFDPLNDIYDIHFILKHISLTETSKQKEIYNFIKEELKVETNTRNLDSNLAKIINILANIDWNEDSIDKRANTFAIDSKITFNNLDSTQYIIKDYALYHTKIDAQYSEFDRSGCNKSMSVLATIKRAYTNLKIQNTAQHADKIFMSVIDSVRNKILESKNYIEIPVDELDLCIDILVVDAFIRCKIFDNPEGYNYASS